MRHFLKAGGVLILALAAAAIVPVERRRYTCLICRGYRVESRCLGLTFRSDSETDCSRWYVAHVEPSHTHAWERGVCVYQSNLLGVPLRVGCSPGRFPIWRLEPDTQLAVYRHFERPIEAKAIFAGLADAKTHDDRLEEDIDSKGALIVEAMTAWELEGFPGSWGEFWDKFYARHVAEHEDWLRWLKSDSNTSYPDWKERHRNGVR
jgi:hypothetical protein